jgi:hypothetical protein
MATPLTPAKWQRFSIAMLFLALVILFFSSGWTPPGPAGDVLRHNQQRDIDASPLFYSEVENITDLQKELAAGLDSARTDSTPADSILPEQ